MNASLRRSVILALVASVLLGLAALAAGAHPAHADARQLLVGPRPTA